MEILGPGGGGGASQTSTPVYASEAVGNDRVKQGGVMHHEQEARERASEREQGRHQCLAPQRPHRLRPTAQDEFAQLAPEGGRHAIDLKISARAERLEIGDQRAVERGLTRDRQRRQSRSIK